MRCYENGFNTDVRNLELEYTVIMYVGGIASLTLPPHLLCGNDYDRFYN